MARTPTARMTSLRRTALVAGVLYLVTFATSIPALGLYDGVLNDPAFVQGAGSDSAVAWGAVLEIILGVAGIGTAVVLYPVLRHWSRETCVALRGTVPRRWARPRAAARQTCLPVSLTKCFRAGVGSGT